MHLLLDTCRYYILVIIPYLPIAEKCNIFTSVCLFAAGSGGGGGSGPVSFVGMVGYLGIGYPEV